MLKLVVAVHVFECGTQPPSGGCVLKLKTGKGNVPALVQPPSGGCVLKLSPSEKVLEMASPAAFRRLCVETLLKAGICKKFRPAAFRRLCVETWCPLPTQPIYPGQPPSGGCVLKPAVRMPVFLSICQPPSGGCVLKQKHNRTPAKAAKPAAFRRLCVETRLKQI